MKIAIPQINYHIGDISKNKDLIIAAIKKAKAMKANSFFFPNTPSVGLTRKIFSKKNIS